MRKNCRWCRVPIREREVLVGPPGELRPVTMFIDKDPHPDGTVIQRDDGKYRLLWTATRPSKQQRAVVPAFRVHGRNSCAPDREEVHA